jgi:hypothetical protein
MNTTCDKTGKDIRSRGSALILAVVLTTLLAIVGVLFFITGSVEKTASSAVSDSKDLNLAVDTVVARLSSELVRDTPGAADANLLENRIKAAYDYPDLDNPWLASIEPTLHSSGTIYYWKQVSNIYGAPARGLILTPVEDKTKADADGDGVADSWWVRDPNMTSSKGQPIYVAVRVVDNGGMLNVNTGYMFDPSSGDGSSVTQVDLAGLSPRGVTNGTPAQAASTLQNWRCGTESTDLPLYEQNVIWQYENIIGEYTPFDISDELKLRNRYILNFTIDLVATQTSRIEELWTNAYDGGLEVPLTYVPTPSADPKNWFYRTNFYASSPDDCNYYDYRHISTTYNMDRVIIPADVKKNASEVLIPAGGKMINVNRVSDVNALFYAVWQGLQDGDFNNPSVAQQIAVNLKDYVDEDSEVTAYGGSYGFERPCVYISELASRVTVDSNLNTYRSYAVELYKPYSEDTKPSIGWKLAVKTGITNAFTPITISWTGTSQFHVIQHGQIPALIVVDFNDPNSTCDPNTDPNCDPNNAARLQTITKTELDANQPLFKSGDHVQLLRTTSAGDVVVDEVDVPGWLVGGSTGTMSLQRDINRHKCIRRLWDSNSRTETLGRDNQYNDPNVVLIQAHPANKKLTNIGEIGMVLAKSAYFNSIGPTDTEETVRVNLADTRFQRLFNYLTVIDPADNNNPPAETRIKGRININTAPWFVLVQLPWVWDPNAGNKNDSFVPPFNLSNLLRGGALARAIVARRDAIGGFRSIGELMQVPGIDFYAKDGEQMGMPDLIGNDGAPDDFEERDLIFARISNLVTVRSDVFSVYILVRIGSNGPQKRVIAILDRSDVRPDNKKVRVIAVHPVPDPR